MIIARIIRSDCNLILTWKRLASTKNNNVFAEIILHDFKLLCPTISKLTTLPHNQETAKINSTNNFLILATSTESTINYQKKNNGPSLLCQSISPRYTLLYCSLLPKKNPVALYVHSKKQSRKR